MLAALCCALGATGCLAWCLLLGGRWRLPRRVGSATQLELVHEERVSSTGQSSLDKHMLAEHAPAWDIHWHAC